jgi:hypothetical protein
MIYHCPKCNKELTKGKAAAWVSWFIGPLFGLLIRPLLCNEHGEIDIETLSPDEQTSVNTKKWIGIIVGGLVNIGIVILIILNVV